VNQLVHRLQLSRKGSTFSGRRSPDETSSEFLTSTDRWFRPVQVRTGPDGALWIVDMYRYVIEHPQWIPPETLTGLNAFAGQGMGRIYRVVNKDRPARQPVKLVGVAAAELAIAIDSPNGPQRDLAQELLVTSSAVPVDQLSTIVKSSRWPAARVQAASTLAATEDLQPNDLLTLLADKTPEVRRHGVKLSQPFLNDATEVLTAVMRLVDDPAPEVRLQLAYSLGECRDERVAPILAAIGVNPANDPYLNHAVMSSVRADNIVAILRSTLTHQESTRQSSFVESLLTMAAAVGDDSTVGAVIGQLVGNSDAQNANWRWKTLSRVLDAADRRKLSLGSNVPDDVKQRVVENYAAARQSLANEKSDDNE
jgi:hypothetical protein